MIKNELKLLICYINSFSCVKAALTSEYRKAISNLRDYGEGRATDTYENALKNDSEYLTTEQQTMIKAKHGLLKADHYKVKSIHNTLGEVA